MLSIFLTSQVLPEEIPPAWEVVGVVFIRFSFYTPVILRTIMPNGKPGIFWNIDAVRSRFTYTSLYSILSYCILPRFTVNERGNPRPWLCALATYFAYNSSILPICPNPLPSTFPVQPVALFLFLPPVKVRVFSLPSTPDGSLYPMLILRFSTPPST